MIPSTSSILKSADLMMLKNRAWHEVGLDSNFTSTTHQLCEFQQGTQLIIYKMEITVIPDMAVMRLKNKMML